MVIKCHFQTKIIFFYFSVKASREEANEQTKNLKEEVIARLEKTREDIAEVEGKTVTSIGEVYENINSTEEKHSLSISHLSDSLVVLKDCKIANIALFHLKVIF